MKQTPNYNLPLLTDVDKLQKVKSVFTDLMGDNEESAMSKIDTALNNNKDRANHTGQQTADTISDFESAVQQTQLTNLVTTENSDIITDGDTILSALGKLQGQINNASSNYLIYKENVALNTLTDIGIYYVVTLAAIAQVGTYNYPDNVRCGLLFVSEGEDGITQTLLTLPYNNDYQGFEVYYRESVDNDWTKCEIDGSGNVDVLGTELSSLSLSSSSAVSSSDTVISGMGKLQAQLNEHTLTIGKKLTFNIVAELPDLESPLLKTDEIYLVYTQAPDYDGVDNPAYNYDMYICTPSYSTGAQPLTWTKALDYSKKVATVQILLFAAAVFGFGLVWAVSSKTPEQLSVGIQWVSAVGTPNMVVLTAYMAKSGGENITRIRNTTSTKDGTVTEQTVEK